MKAAKWTVLPLAVALILAFSAVAKEKKDKAAKEVTLKGTVTCAKCGLKLEDAKKCATVIQVMEKDKDGKEVAVVYYFDKDVHGKYHDDICTKAKAGTVKGTVTEKDGKKTVKVSEVKYD
jgi:hypothetical protein